MSEANLAVVRRIYDEIVDDPDSIRDHYHPDYEMDLRDVGPDIGVVRGFDAADAALRPYFEMFDEFEVVIDEVIHEDEKHVVVAVHDGGRMRGSDAEVRNPRFHVFTFRDGKVVRFTPHLERERALADVGVAE